MDSVSNNSQTSTVPASSGVAPPATKKRVGSRIKRTAGAAAAVVPPAVAPVVVEEVIAAPAPAPMEVEMVVDAAAPVVVDEETPPPPQPPITGKKRPRNTSSAAPGADGTGAVTTSSRLPPNTTADGLKIVGSKKEVFMSKAVRTRGGLSKDDLISNRRGKIVSRKKSELARERGFLAGNNASGVNYYYQPGQSPATVAAANRAAAAALNSGSTDPRVVTTRGPAGGADVVYVQ